MIRGALLLHSLYSVYAYDGGDDTALLLQQTTIEEDSGFSDDDHSALQAAGTPRAPLAESFKTHARDVHSHQHQTADAARSLMGLMELSTQMSMETGNYYSTARSNVPDQHAVSVLQGGIKLPLDEPVMTICNAYAFPEPLDIKLLRTGEHMLSGLQYKDCVDMVDMELEVGDDLEFMARGSPLGVFHVASIPQGGTQLLLVPHRRHGDSYLMKFESHAFQRAEYKQPMIATIDTYQGASSTYVRLVQDGLRTENVIRVENVSYGTVSVVTVGDFQVQLVGHEGVMPQAYTNVSTALGRNYVVLRVGGGNYPQELVVYPSGYSAAWRLGLSSLAGAVALLAAVAHVA